MLYNYKGFHGCDSCCDIKVYGNIVVATQNDDNQGTSITNKAEDIAIDIAKMHGIKLNELVWYECYEGRLSACSKVEFEIEKNQFVNPSWEKESKENIQEMIQGIRETTKIK